MNPQEIKLISKKSKKHTGRHIWYEGSRGTGAVSIPECCPDGHTLDPGQSKDYTWHEIHHSYLPKHCDIHQRAIDFYQSEYIEDKEAFNAFCSELHRVLEEGNNDLWAPLTIEEVHVEHAGRVGSRF